MQYYLSLQYSAIQKTVLRHDRLWSIAGVSQILSSMNEIEMRTITKEYHGTAIIAGGGKFTARFNSRENAEMAKKAIIKLISTNLPMLEFQISSVVEAESLNKARIKTEINGMPYPGLVHELSEKKRCFRGYGVTFNPHFAVCGECEEYPAEKGFYAPEDRRLCRICGSAREAARINLNGLKGKDEDALTSMEKIYREYINHLNTDRDLHIPLLMEDMFPNKESKEEVGRIAVWMSDVNGMGDIIPFWLGQPEDDIPKTFDNLKRLLIDALTQSLKKVFSSKSILERDNVGFIPFRLIVAGGDDLCIVMPEEYILDFVANYSSEMKKRAEEATTGRYGPAFTKKWLEEEAQKAKKEAEKAGKSIEKKYSFNDISFGGSFIVTSIHTPFTKIHALGEELMSQAKKATERKSNSVNWRILSADEESVLDKKLKAERPLFIEESLNNNTLSFKEYIELRKKHKGISGSHLHQIVNKMIEFNQDPEGLETWLLRLPDASKDNSAISKMLSDERLKDSDRKQLNTARLVTLFELITLKKGNE